MSRRRGNDNENAFCKIAEELGYCTYPSRGSRGPIDVLCFEDELANREPFGIPRGLVPLAVQVGTQCKRIATTLAELEASSRPIGSLCIVARKIKVNARKIRWKFSIRGGSFDSLQAAIEARASA